MECFPEMEGELTFCIGSLHSKIELFIPSAEAELGGKEETGVGRAVKTGDCLKARLSALCGSLTFLLLQMTKL